MYPRYDGNQGSMYREPCPPTLDSRSLVALAVYFLLTAFQFRWFFATLLLNSRRQEPKSRLISDLTI